jgi:hypothetical protein
MWNICIKTRQFQQPYRVIDFSLFRNVQNVIAILCSDSWLSFQQQQRTLLTTKYRLTAHRRQANTKGHRLSVDVLVLAICRFNSADCSISWTLGNRTKFINSSTQLTWEKSWCFKCTGYFLQYEEKWLQHVQRMDTNRLPEQRYNINQKDEGT